MLAFAGNSLLCRQALQESAIDPASFTTLRLASGALALWLIVRVRRRAQIVGGSWLSALALFAYAAGFSFAYASLTAATGALLLFGAVQATMIGYGLWCRERFATLQVAGFVLAFAGLISFLVPGLAAPPVHGTLLMLGAGAAWGIYSLRGTGGGDPIAVTTGNFQRAVPMALVLSLLQSTPVSIDSPGILYALASGALTSGIGYAIWYAALPGLEAGHAASVQLSVPIIAALGGVVLLGESITLRLSVAAVAVLGGIAMVVARRPS